MPLVRLAAFGALAVALGIVGIFALLVFFTTPTPTGGIDWTLAQLTWISVGGVVLALIAIHVVYARVLFGVARGDR
jgi:hypothetical protein